jgi:hypothetical protein
VALPSVNAEPLPALEREAGEATGPSHVCQGANGGTAEVHFPVPLEGAARLPEDPDVVHLGGLRQSAVDDLSSTSAADRRIDDHKHRS